MNFLNTQNVYLLVFLAIWEMIWKGLALWRAARNGQSTWFIALFLINSLGILPILYLRFFSCTKKSQAKK